MLAFRSPQHLRRPQRIDVAAARSRNRHRRIGKNPVSARYLSRTNAVELEWDRLAIQHRYQPADWAHKPLVRLAPVHILRPVNSGNFFRERFAEDFGSSAPFFG